MDLLDHSAPEATALHHIGLFTGGNAALTLTGEVEGNAGNTLDFRRGVDLGIDAALGAVRQVLDTAWLTEIDAAGQLAHDHDVEAADDFRLQAGGIDQRIEHQRRA